MKKLPAASDSDDLGTAGAQNTTLYLIVSMMDTTWRMFAPTISLLLLGNYLDDSFATTPWLMLLGVVFGGGIAVLLVKRQLAAGRRHHA